MSLVSPFRALSPLPGRAGELIAPPYDVMSVAEARAMASGRPHSFVHVSRPEIDLPEGSDPHTPAAYARARENFRALQDDGLLARDPAPCLYVYRLIQGAHSQTGLAAVASVAAYRDGRIKKHELTRPTKENDRVAHIEALDAQTGPVYLMHRAAESIDRLLAEYSAGVPRLDVVGSDGVRHLLWRVQDSDAVAALVDAYARLDALYIADGHHRAAAAARVAAARPDDAAAQAFLAVIFPEHQTRILAYNRLIRDLNGLSAEAFLARLAQDFDLALEPSPRAPERPGVFGLYLDRCWYRLELKSGAHARLATGDAAARLDASLLQDWLIRPLLGIDDPRTDGRIDFVGGSRGLEGLIGPVDRGEMRLALALHPTSPKDLMAVADAGALMPPKSTWFEPKLADGLLCHLLS